MGVIKNRSVPVGELVREVVGPENTDGNYISGRIAYVKLAGGVSSGVAFAWENRESNPIAVTKVVLSLTANAGGSSQVMAIHVVSSSGTVGSATAGSIKVSALGVLSNLSSAIDRMEKQGASSDSWLTGSYKSDGGGSSLAGYAAIHYIPLYTT
jgi:hypothetical protein